MVLKFKEEINLELFKEVHNYDIVLALSESRNIGVQHLIFGMSRKTSARKF